MLCAFVGGSGAGHFTVLEPVTRRCVVVGGSGAGSADDLLAAPALAFGALTEALVSTALVTALIAMAGLGV